MLDEQNVTEDRIDIDLSTIDQPFATVEDGTYRLTIKDPKLKLSKAEKRPMLEARIVVVDPATNDEISFNNYTMLDTQPGKYQLRQFKIAAGIDGQRDFEVGQLDGAQFDGELSVEESEEYGRQNRLKKVLVAVPKTQR